MNPETIRQVTFGAGPTVSGGLQPPAVEVRVVKHSRAKARAGWRIGPCRPARGPGRNQPCPCGSGRKNKHCCGRG